MLAVAKFVIQKENLVSKILSVGYPTLSNVRVDNVAKFNSSNYSNCPKTGRPVFGVFRCCPVAKHSGFQTGV